MKQNLKIIIIIRGERERIRKWPGTAKEGCWLRKRKQLRKVYMMLCQEGEKIKADRLVCVSGNERKIGEICFCFFQKLDEFIGHG